MESVMVVMFRPRATWQTCEALIEALGRALEAVGAKDAHGFVEYRDYRPTAMTDALVQSKLWRLALIASASRVLAGPLSRARGESTITGMRRSPARLS
jgi:hypothetical protein